MFWPFIFSDVCTFDRIFSILYTGMDCELSLLHTVRETGTGLISFIFLEWTHFTDWDNPADNFKEYSDTHHICDRICTVAQTQPNVHTLLTSINTPVHLILNILTLKCHSQWLQSVLHVDKRSKYVSVLLQVHAAIPFLDFCISQNAIILLHYWNSDLV